LHFRPSNTFRVLLLSLFLIFERDLAPALGANQEPTRPTLNDTFEWIRSQLDGDQTDATGVRIRTMLHFKKTAGD
jgi:hypothetical protein